MENWLTIVVGIYLLGMVLYGHYRGFIRLAVSMVALVATLVIVNLAMPQVSEFLKEKTPINTMIKDALENAIDIAAPDQEEELPSAQRTAIENLDLPEQLKEILIENNNNEVYDMLHVDEFTDYIGAYLSNVIINIIGFIIMFIVVYALIHIIMRWLDLMAKLPILSGINQIAGALLGAAQGLIFFWIFCLVATAASGSGWGMAVIRQIESSPWLSFLYSHNILIKIVTGVLNSMA